MERLKDQPRVSSPLAAKLPSTWISPSRPSYKWWVAATVMLGAFLVVVSGATVNVALPPIMTTFSMNLDGVQWIITA
jgi:hypothetical protein